MVKLLIFPARFNRVIYSKKILHTYLCMGNKYILCRVPIPHRGKYLMQGNEKQKGVSKQQGPVSLKAGGVGVSWGLKLKFPAALKHRSFVNLIETMLDFRLQGNPSWAIVTIPRSVIQT